MTIHKTISTLILGLAGIVFADNICVELCPYCSENSEDSSCSKVSSVCDCSSIIDSLSEAKATREKNLKQAGSKFIADMNESCTENFCTRTIYFENGIYNRMEQSESSISNEELLAMDSEQTDSKKIAEPKPLTTECTELCSSCPIDEESLESDTLPTFDNPLCQKVESNCGCVSYAKQNMLFTKQVKQDSLDKIEQALLKMENSKILADSLQRTCDTTGSCAVQVTIQKSSYKIAHIQSVDPIKANSSTSILPIDTLTAAASDSDSSAKQQTALEFNVLGNDMPRLYFGINLFGGLMLEEGFPGYSKKNSNGEGLDAGVGAFFRFYFYKWGSIQTGFNAIFRYLNTNALDFDISYNDKNTYIHMGIDSDIDYYNLTFELPINLRLGIGLPLGTCAFASGSFAIRKPFYEWEYVFRSTYGLPSSLNFLEDNSEYSDFFATDAWEFHAYFGFGLQIVRAISVQFQWMVWNERTGYGHLYGFRAFDDGTSWRITLDYIF